MWNKMLYTIKGRNWASSPYISLSKTVWLHSCACSLSRKRRVCNSERCAVCCLLHPSLVSLYLKSGVILAAMPRAIPAPRCVLETTRTWGRGRRWGGENKGSLAFAPTLRPHIAQTNGNSRRSLVWPIVRRLPWRRLATRAFERARGRECGAGMRGGGWSVGCC